MEAGAVEEAASSAPTDGTHERRASSTSSGASEATAPLRGTKATAPSGHASTIVAGAERLELIFRHLKYTVSLKKSVQKKEGIKEKAILNDITAMFKPGRLTAVMGSSGAGKTTLLTVLAGNTQKGRIEGDLVVNGEPYTGRMLKEISGFVFQDDVLLPTMTVREAIAMSALLRIPKSVDREERARRVDDTISILHLDKARNTVVGNPMTKGISGGERKRTAIGMEMVVNPGMIFLDEPTTGLDTFTAFTVILSLSRLAQLGRTVVATIHQPSTEIFNLFDDLLILSRGRVAYYGPTQDAVDYFARQGYPCPEYSNPADYIFMRVLREFGSIEGGEEEEEEEAAAGQEAGQKGKERLKLVEVSDEDAEGGDQGISIRDTTKSLGKEMVTTPNVTSGAVVAASGAAAGTASGAQTIKDRPTPSTEAGQAEARRSLARHSKNQQQVCDERIESLLAAWLASPEYAQLERDCADPSQGGVAVGMLRKRAPLWTQFKYLFKRAGLNFVRNRQLIIARLCQSIFLGVIVGLVFLDTNQYSVSIQIRNKSGALFFIATNTFFAASTQILSIFGLEKPVFYREYQGGYYTVAAYYISKTLIEVPGQIIGPFLLVIICYYMVGLNPPFSAYLLVATLAALGALCGNAYGTLIVSLIDDLNIALTVAPIAILPLLVVSGFFAAAIPGFLNWLKYISPIYYAFSGMIQTEFSRTFPNCDATRENCNGSRAIAELNFSDTFPPGVNIVFLITIFAVLWIAGFLALWIGARRKFQ